MKIKPVYILLIAALLTSTSLAILLKLSRETSTSFQERPRSFPAQIEITNVAPVPPKGSVGYAVSDGYLWKDSVLVTSTKIGVLLDINTDVLEATVWNFFKVGDSDRVYFMVGAGCEGCIHLSSDYLEINHNDIVVKHVRNSNVPLFIDREVASNMAVLSPDKTKAAYVLVNAKVGALVGVDAGKLPPESVYVYDFLTETNTLQSAIPNDKTTVDYCGYSVGLMDDVLVWSPDSQKLFIYPKNNHNRWLIDTSGLLQPGYTAEYVNASGVTEPYSVYTCKNMSVTTMDFNGDGVNEYIVYRKIPLTRVPESFRANWNGEFEVFMQKPNTSSFVKVYADKGTLDQKNPGSDLMLFPDFFEKVDIDNDGTPEAKITRISDGTGVYRISYILKWNGSALTKVPVEEAYKSEEAAKYLKAGEQFGAEDIGYVPICPPDDVSTQCPVRASAPDSVGLLRIEYKLENGIFVPNKFTRE